MKPTIKTVIAIAVCAASTVASAYETGDWIVRGGIVNVSPDDDSSEVSVIGSDVPGTAVEVDDDTQLLLNITYMANENLGVELLAATPFEHDLTLDTGSLGLGNVDLGSTKHLPPTLSLLWYPMSGKSAFQPFVGAGVNYTRFFDESLSGTAKAGLGANNLQLDDSWGLAFRAGVDYLFNDCWSFHAGMYYLDIDTGAELDTALGQAKVDVDINPWVYTLGVGYRF